MVSLTKGLACSSCKKTACCLPFTKWSLYCISCFYCEMKCKDILIGFMRVYVRARGPIRQSQVVNEKSLHRTNIPVTINADFAMPKHRVYGQQRLLGCACIIICMLKSLSSWPRSVLSVKEIGCRVRVGCGAPWWRAAAVKKKRARARAKFSPFMVRTGSEWEAFF